MDIRVIVFSFDTEDQLDKAVEIAEQTLPKHISEDIIANTVWQNGQPHHTMCITDMAMKPSYVENLIARFKEAGV